VIKNGQDLNLPSPLAEGTVIATGGGESGFKSIFHIVLKRYKKTGGHTLDKISEIITKILEMANEMGLKSIVIPPIGSGVLKTPISVCATAIQNGIVQFLSELDGVDPLIKKINLCIFDPKLLEEFKTSWKNSMDMEEEKEYNESDESDDEYAKAHK